MQWYDFVFSEKKQIRLLRHGLFWVAWAAYFLLCDYLFRQPKPPGLNYGITKPGYVIFGTQWIPETLMLVCLYAGACYFFIHSVLPQLINRQWMKAVTHITILCLVLFISAWFMYWNLFPFIDSLFGPYEVNDYFAPFWPPLYLGIINTMKVIATAAIIKYVKYWWLKQKEKEKLEKERMNAELRLLKAQIRPDFLFNSLDKIREFSITASPLAPETLIKLSDLLSYMLYECDKPLVPLDKEIKMMKYYMELEKIRLGEAFEMGINTRGQLNDKKIAPSLLLPFIENSFKQCSNLNGSAWIVMDIGMEDDSFYMRIANGTTSETIGLAEQGTNGLTNIQKRLTLIYPQHQLEFYKEQEMVITYLKIQLNDLTTTIKPGNSSTKTAEQY